MAVPLALTAATATLLLWGTGVVVGSILGSTLPGAAGDGLVAMLTAFPDIGAAWQPAIPSLPIWATAITLAALLTPLIWRLIRAHRLQETGAQWATTSDLRRAGLLLANRTPRHALTETPEVTADAN